MSCFFRPHQKDPLRSTFKQSTLALAVSAAVFSQSTLGQDDEVETGEQEIQEIVVEGQVRRGGVTDLAVDQIRFGTQIQLISADEIATGGFTNFGELSAGLIRGANIGYSPDEGEFTIRIDGISGFIDHIGQ